MYRIITLALCLSLGVSLGFAEAKKGNPGKGSGASKTSSAKVFVVADFDSGAQPNNVGGKYGSWDKDPNDDTQGCKANAAEPGYNNKGKCVKLSYRVESPNPAYNGFWMKLEGADASKYNKLTFYVKGDAKEKFTTKFKIEIKNDKEVSPYYVTTVTDKWSKVEIPFSEFGLISDWGKMKEFVIVFEDGQATEKIGSLYIDNVAFEK